MTMTEGGKVAATGIVRRLRDGRFKDEDLDAMLNHLTALLGEHDINLLHVLEDAGDLLHLQSVGGRGGISSSGQG